MCVSFDGDEGFMLNMFEDMKGKYKVNIKEIEKKKSRRGQEVIS